MLLASPADCESSMRMRWAQSLVACARGTERAVLPPG
jgi:hypothetical protein